jgi:hypothetical protein
MHSPQTRNDWDGGHINPLSNKGYTSPKTIRGDCGDDGDLTIRHEGDPNASGFEAFPRGDEGDLSFRSPSAAPQIKERLGAAVAGSRPDSRADSRGFRMPRILGRIITTRR